MATFIGFSTVDRKGPPYTLTDLELVKQDILNQLKTSKGERVMLPEFGSIIPDILMEPLTDATIGYVKEDVTQIINADPRVKLLDINVSAMNNTLRCEIHLEYKIDQTADVLIAEFEAETGISIQGPSAVTTPSDSGY